MFFIKKRILKEADYIINNNATLRQTAVYFKVGKSTIHKDMNVRLIKINNQIYNKVRKVLDEHLKTRHLKGGEVTKMKYKLLRT